MREEELQEKIGRMLATKDFKSSVWSVSANRNIAVGRGERMRPGSFLRVSGIYD